MKSERSFYNYKNYVCFPDWDEKSSKKKKKKKNNVREKKKKTISGFILIY